jgi:hypothetical protein
VLARLRYGRAIGSLAPSPPQHYLRVATEHLAYETMEALHASGTSITFEQYAADLADYIT